MKYMEASTIAARCNHAGATHIKKSYVRNIKSVARRQGIDWFLFEEDFAFTHKGIPYIVCEEIVGDKRISALRRYTVKCIQDSND